MMSRDMLSSEQRDLSNNVQAEWTDHIDCRKKMKHLVCDPLLALLLSNYPLVKNKRLLIIVILGLLTPFLYESLISQGINPWIHLQKVYPQVYYVGYYPFLFSRKYILQESKWQLARIYEEQLHQHRIAPFISTYENHRLKLRMNLTSLAIFLYGKAENFQGSIR